MRRPLLGVALCFMGGILLREYCPIPPVWQWGLAVAFAAATFLSLLFPCPDWIQTPLVLLLVVAVGVLRETSTKLPAPTDDIRHRVGEDAVVTKLRGVIDTAPEVDHREPTLARFFGDAEAEAEARTTFDLRVHAMQRVESWQAVCGTVRVRVREEVSDLGYGDGVEVTASIYRPRPPTNPGQFDYKMFLERQGVFVQAIADFGGNVRVISRGNGLMVKRWVFGLRQAADSFVARNSTPRTRGILQCMLLGYRRAIADDQEQAFIKSGTVHVLAISGLHLMILAGTLWWGLCLTRLDRRVNAVIVLVFVVFFVLMTGMRACVARAGIMTGFMCAGEMLDRRRDSINSLAAAAVVILFGNPNEIFSAGFQLSFAAVLGILCFVLPIKEFLFGPPTLFDQLAVPGEKSLPRKLLRGYTRISIATSTAAVLATSPLVAWHFHIFSPLAILYNVLVFPFVWLIVSLGGVTVALGVTCEKSAWPLAWVLNQITLLFAKVIVFIGNIPSTCIYLPGPSLSWLIIFYAILIAAAWRTAIPLRRVQVWILLGLCFIIPNTVRAVSPLPERLKITCLDVGHGAAFLVEFPNGRNLLYDAGTWSKIDAGTSVVAPFLWHEGVRKLDALVISHAHYDHYSGVPAVYDRFNTGKVLINSRFTSLPITQAITGWVKYWGADVVEVEAGDRITGYGDCVVEVLHPPVGEIVARMQPNNRSCVVRIGWHGFSFLLTGDIEENGVRILQKNFPGLRAEAMQIPHHGSLSPLVLRFVEGMSPRFAWVNTSEAGLSGPVSALADSGIKVYNTRRNGAITLEVHPGGWVGVRTFLKPRAEAHKDEPILSR